LKTEWAIAAKLVFLEKDFFVSNNFAEMAMREKMDG
jgi:hypothetical protein